MKTLAEVIPYGTAEEYRVAYEGTPRNVRTLFSNDRRELDGDGWLIRALVDGETQMFNVPSWVQSLVHVPIPTLTIAPDKALGMWRVSGGGGERYIPTERLERAFQATKTLFRPVGQKELALIRETGWTRFPPRLPEQPIFYPVVQETYAHKIAQWNAKDEGVGYVLRFEVELDFLRAYPEQVAGGSGHLEHWIPAAELEAFNDAIVGTIELVGTELRETAKKS